MKTMQNPILILLGPPGAGKGSQAAMIREKLNLPHISTGDLLRGAIQNKDPLGLEAQEYMNRGELVPDRLIFAIFFARVEQEDCQRGYILDGFPRNLEQAEILSERLGQDNICAINLTLDDEAIVERITQRLVCKSCSYPYHRTFSPPRNEQLCDQCDGDLMQRDDDREDIVRKRLEVYHGKTAPLIQYYNQLNVLHTVSSDNSKEAVLLQILKIISE